jgi:hypothetical protein
MDYDISWYFLLFNWSFFSNLGFLAFCSTIFLWIAPVVCPIVAKKGAVKKSTGHIFVDKTFKISIQETFFILRPMDQGKNGRTLDGRSARKVSSFLAFGQIIVYFIVLFEITR